MTQATISKFMRTTALTAVTLAASFTITSPAHAVGKFATPTGGTVVGGSATITNPSQGVLNVNQSTDRAVINWDKFNIGTQATTEFFQPDTGSLAVNRVVGANTNPSKILGTLKANGNIVVLDQNGVIFGRNSVVDVNGIIASTGDVSTAEIMSGANTFDIYGFTDNPISARGTINVADAGLAAFVSPFVSNSGTINAKVGRVAMAAGERVTVDLYGDELISIAVENQLADALLSNTGTINAEGGIVTMTASAAEAMVDNVINLNGVVNVGSITEENGKIVLNAGDYGKARIKGTINDTVADNSEVSVSGNTININKAARINTELFNITTDNANFNKDAIVTADTVNITRQTLGDISLGSYDFGLSLTDRELDILRASSLNIGSTNATESKTNEINVTGIDLSDNISGVVTLSSLTNSGGDIEFNAGHNKFNSLVANANDDIVFRTNSVTIETTSGDMTFRADADNNLSTGDSNKIETYAANILPVSNPQDTQLISTADINLISDTYTAPDLAMEATGDVNLEVINQRTVGLGNGSGQTVFAQSFIDSITAFNLNIGGNGNVTDINLGTVAINGNISNAIELAASNSVNVEAKAEVTLDTTNLDVDTQTVNLAADIQTSGDISGNATTANIANNNAEIKDGIDLVANGATVNIAAGEYSEAVEIDKEVTIYGANAGIAGYSTRGAETIINNNGSDWYNFYITSDNVTIDGLKFVGNGDANNSDYLVTANATANTVVRNNIVTDANFGIFYWGNGSTATEGGMIANNMLHGIDTQAIHVRGSQYADVVNNVIYDAKVGIAVDYMGRTKPTASVKSVVDSNIVSASAIGIRNNAVTGNGTGYIVSNNSITAEDTTSDRRWTGIDIISQPGDIDTAFVNNYIDASAIAGSGRLAVGYEATNVISENVTITGGSVNNTDYGVWATDGSFYTGTVNNLTVSEVAFNNINQGAIIIEDTIDVNNETGVNATGAHITIGDGNIFNNAAYDLVLNGENATVTTTVKANIKNTLVKAAGDAVYTDNPWNTKTTLSTEAAVIQEAVDATSNGGTVTIEAGTFAQDTNVDKSLTINGANAGIFHLAKRGAETLIEATGAGFNITADNVTLDGLDIKGGTPSIKIDNADNILITNNIIREQTSGGSAADGITINNSRNVEITNNIIHDAGDEAIYARGNIDGLNVSANIISNVTNNAIELYSARGSATFENNFISNANNGFLFRNANNLGNIEVHNNRISASRTFAMSNEGSVTIDASGNYWGSTNEATITSSINGDVDFTPYLLSSTDTDSNLYNGFQGDFSRLFVTANGSQTQTGGRINEGIQSIVSAGFTTPELNVGAGTFNENIIIDRELNISGNNRGLNANSKRATESFINANNGSVVTIASGGVSLNGFEIDGGSTGIEVAHKGGSTHIINNIVTSNDAINITSSSKSSTTYISANNLEADNNGIAFSGDIYSGSTTLISNSIEAGNDGIAFNGTLDSGAVTVERNTIEAYNDGIVFNGNIENINTTTGKNTIEAGNDGIAFNGDITRGYNITIGNTLEAGNDGIAFNGLIENTLNAVVFSDIEAGNNGIAFNAPITDSFTIAVYNEIEAGNDGIYAGDISSGKTVFAVSRINANENGININGALTDNAEIAIEEIEEISATNGDAITVTNTAEGLIELNITENLDLSSENGNAIAVNNISEVNITDNTVTEAGLSGIVARNSGSVRVNGNIVSNSAEAGLYIAGEDNGYAVISDNILSSNTIGALFESGIINLTSTSNIYNENEIAMKFDNVSTDNKVSLIGNTIGRQIFNDNGQYIVLNNGALFAETTDENNITTVVEIDAMRSVFDGFVPANTNSPFEESELAKVLESSIFDNDDLETLGQIFTGDILDDSEYEDMMNGFRNLDRGNGTFSVSVRSLPYATNAQRLNGLSPAAGEGTEGNSPEDLNNLEPAAGDNSSPCWSAIGSGATISYSVGDQDNMINAAAYCASNI